MRLMLLIMAFVLGGFMLLNAFIQRKQKKQHHVINEDFEKKILENPEDISDSLQELNLKKSHDLSEQDPLLDNITPSTFYPELTVNNAPRDVLDEVNEENSLTIDDQSKSKEFVALTILPKHSGYFSASTLIATLVKNHFFFGKQKLYHRHIQDNPLLPIMYSVGSLSKPGYFEPHLKLKQSFPGIFIYMALDIADLEQTFEKMLTCARQLSASLNAQICDDKRNLLSTLALKNIKEKLRD